MLKVKKINIPKSVYSLFIVFIILMVLISKFEAELNYYENKFYDFKINFCNKFRPDPNKIKEKIVIIYINDKKTKSLIGDISSDLHAKLIEKLKKYEVKSIYYDLIFDSSVSDVLIKTVKDAGNVFLPAWFDLIVNEKNAYWIEKYPAYFKKIIENNSLLTENFSGQFFYAGKGELPNEELAKAAKGIGHISAGDIENNKNKIQHKAALLIDVDKHLLPSVDLMLACDYLKVPIDLVAVEPGKSITLMQSNISGNKVVDLEIPINDKCEMLINYNKYGNIKGQEFFKSFSFVTVINPDNKPEIESELSKKFKDKICLIGYYSYPGTKMYNKNKLNINANSQILYSILSGNFIKELSLINMFIIFMISIALFSYLVKDFKGGVTLLISLDCIIAYFIVSYLVFIYSGTVFFDIIPILGFFIFGNINFFIDYIVREREIDKLEYRSSMDSLTNVFNRRGFFNTIDYLAQLAKANNYSIGIMVIDIDDFKNINDTHGHQKGDEIIQRVVDIIKKQLRKTDVIGRYGGDEFLLFLYGVDINDLLNISEKIRQSVEVETKNEIPVTVSIGVSNNFIKSTDIDKEIDTLIQKADESLYTAKSKGRNKVFIYSS